MRDTTHDMDSSTAIPAKLRAAVATVAQRHDLNADWLNDRAPGITPTTFSVEECQPVFESARLIVLGAPFARVFVMKLYRNDA